VLDWVVFPCEKALGCSCRSKRSRRPEYRVEARLHCRFPISGALGVEPSPSPRSETEAALGLSQRRALILVLVLSFALCAGIWVTVALLSVAGGDDLG
jgi:hypothetical protein